MAKSKKVKPEEVVEPTIPPEVQKNLAARKTQVEQNLQSSISGLKELENKIKTPKNARET